MDFGEKLTERLLSFHLTLEDLSSQSGVPLERLKLFVASQDDSSSVNIAVRVARCLGLPWRAW